MNPELNVSLGPGRSYPIHIGTGLLHDADVWKRCVEGTRAVVVTNRTVADIYLDRVFRALPHIPQVIEIGDGEEFKTLGTFAEIIDQLVAEKQDRSVIIIALGGGVVGDVTGLVAATYLRGVKLIQVPTTLLAQVDSAVGGKTAVNHTQGKNLIGAFYQPQSVIIDVEVLETLPTRIFLEGLAEVIKYGVIHDASFFEWLENHSELVLARDTESLKYIVRRSCEIKAKIVQIDEREQGLRAILNFGHTFGHAIEALCEYGTYLHGEAVAMGMRLAANLSSRLKLCSPDDVWRVEHLLDIYGLKINMPQLTPNDMIEAMTLDKKVQDGTIRFVLLSQIGKVDVVKNHNHQALSTTIESLMRNST